jgi:hypothetical protein
LAIVALIKCIGVFVILSAPVRFALYNNYRGR